MTLSECALMETPQSTRRKLGRLVPVTRMRLAITARRPLACLAVLPQGPILLDRASTNRKPVTTTATLSSRTPKARRSTATAHRATCRITVVPIPSPVVYLSFPSWASLEQAPFTGLTTVARWRCLARFPIKARAACTG